MSSAGRSRETWLATLKEEAAASEKKWWIAFALSLFLGAFGLDRFYLGYGIYGLIKLLSFGGLGVLWIVDVLLLVSGYTKDADGGVLKRW